MTLHVAFLVFVSWDFCCFDSVVVVVVGGGGRGGRQERVCLGVEGGGGDIRLNFWCSLVCGM